MLRAYDTNGADVAASAGIRGKPLTCPACGQPVIVKAGLVRRSHFAHLSGTCQNRRYRRRRLDSAAAQQIPGQLDMFDDTNPLTTPDRVETVGKVRRLLHRLLRRARS